RGLPVRGLVGVDHALAGGLVELAGSVAHQGGGGLGVTLGAALVELADRRLQGGLHGLVPQPALLVRPVALDLGLDVRHATASFGFLVNWSQTQGARDRRATNQPISAAGAAQTDYRSHGRRAGYPIDRAGTVRGATLPAMDIDRFW